MAITLNKYEKYKNPFGDIDKIFVEIIYKNEGDEILKSDFLSQEDFDKVMTDEQYLTEVIENMAADAELLRTRTISERNNTPESADEIKKAEFVIDMERLIRKQEELKGIKR